jgi:prepilin-type N-terminal cleavage/methylation domain-containing protein
MLSFLLRPRKGQLSRGDDGLGLIEIVVALMILGILAISFLPILIQGLQTSVTNATRASAGQIAQQQIEIARAGGEDCSDLATLAATEVSSVTDGRGTVLDIAKTIDTCPVNFPSTVKYTVTVSKHSTHEQIVVATTLIYVSAA